MTARRSKERSIASAVKNGAPLEALKEFCISKHGLVSDKRRIEVWPKLLGIKPSSTLLQPMANAHSEQIEKDCERSLHQFNVTSKMSAEAKVMKQNQLSRILNSVFASDSSLHYYQGFNDISSIFLLVAGESLGQQLAVQSALLYLRDCMRPSFDYGTKAELTLVYTLLRRCDPELAAHVEELCLDVSPKQFPLFCVSWLLTWFSHDLFNFDTICRIFDFILASHSLTPVYLTVEILLFQKAEIMRVQDLGVLHKFFEKRLEVLPWEKIIAKSSSLMGNFAPETLCTLASPPFLPE
mmetsp:Transcript_18676/g.33784  ORF Transcript_18676/g.33784 Transcript_18676/m.33784 type:complete len:296 (+) Transcript_18676:144-1031(+)